MSQNIHEVNLNDVTDDAKSRLTSKSVKGVRATLFSDKLAQEKQEAKWGSLADLNEMIKGTSAAEKSQLPWIKLAGFGDNRSEAGCLRRDGNVVALYGIECDIDGGPISMGEAAKQRAGTRALLYATPSSTPEAPHYRVLLPFDHAYTGAAEELKAFRGEQVAKVNATLDGVVARESFTLSQSFYFGGINGTPVETILTAPYMLGKLEGGAAIDIINNVGLRYANGSTTAPPIRKFEAVSCPDIGLDIYPDRAEAYCQKLAEAGDDPGRFQLACALTRNFGLSNKTATELCKKYELRTWSSKTNGQTWETKLDNARKYGKGELGCGVAWQHPVSDSTIPPDWLAHAAPPKEQRAEEQEGSNPAADPFAPRPIAKESLHADGDDWPRAYSIERSQEPIPEVIELIPGFAERHMVTILEGVGGVGKSLIALQDALCIASGRRI